jgi:hypothetical protein
MNLAVGTILLSVVLMSMLLFCCAHAADNQTGKLHFKAATTHSNRPGVARIAPRMSQRARPEDTVRLTPTVAPTAEETREKVMESPLDSPENSVQFKGVRG